MASRRESNSGLIITLVFSILLNIILAVVAYYGFAGQADTDEARKKAEDDLKDMTGDRNWYKFQSLALRKFTGNLQAKDEAELGSLRAQFDKKDSDKERLGAKSKDRVEIETLIAKLEKDPDLTEGAAKIDYAKRVDLLKKKLRDTEAGAQKDKEAVAAANAQLKKKDEDLIAAKASYTKELADLEKKEEAKHAGYIAQIKELQTVTLKLADDNKKENEAHLLVVEGKDKLVKALSKDLAEHKAKEQKIAAQTASVTSVLDFDSPKGKIVVLDAQGNPFINLGSADNVKPQLTFSIVGIEADGKPSKEPKGSLEVISVISDHLSKAKVTAVRDPARDPVLRSDLLFNPAWSPTLRQHVAIVGLVDLNGDGRDDIADFMRGLQKQGIIVDAHLDMKERKIKGEILRQTDYLIEGDRPDYGSGSVKEDDLKAQERTNLEKKWAEMQDEAIRKGVPTIKLRKFLAMTGYPVPPGAERRTPDFRQGPTAVAPKELPKMADQPAVPNDKAR